MLKYTAFLLATGLLVSQLQRAEAQSNPVKPLQQFNGDTVAYLKENFIQNKQQYIHNKLDSLLKNLGIPVISYDYHIQFSDHRYSAGISFSFYSGNQFTIMAAAQKQLVITVLWDIPVLMDSAIFFGEKSNSSWLKGDRDYYKNKTIKDILLSYHPFPKQTVPLYPYQPTLPDVNVDSAGNVTLKTKDK